MVFIVEANLLGNMNVQETTGASKLKLSTVVTGSAGQGKIGPPLGVVDIGVSESAYLFRVALPGVRKDQWRGTKYKTRILQMYLQQVEVRDRV